MNAAKDDRPGWPEALLRIVVGVTIGALVGVIINSFFEFGLLKFRLITFSSIAFFTLIIFNYWMGFWQLVVGSIAEGLDSSSDQSDDGSSDEKDDA